MTKDYEKGTKSNGQQTKTRRGKKHFVAGSDPIFGVAITPKSLRASGGVPGHGELASLSPVRFLPRLSQTSACQHSLATLARTFGQILPELAGSFCHTFSDEEKDLLCRCLSRQSQPLRNANTTSGLMNRLQSRWSVTPSSSGRTPPITSSARL